MVLGRDGEATAAGSDVGVAAATIRPAAVVVAGLVGVELRLGPGVRLRRIVARRGALFVAGEEARGFEAGPQGFAFGGEGFDVVEVRLEDERCVGIEGAEPGGERAGDAVRERDDGLAPEGAVGFLVVGVGRVAGDAEQLRGDADGQRDLAGGCVLW